MSIRSYEPARPDRYPAFLETRVYQGSSGRVYPLPFIEGIDRDAHVRRWDAVHIENRYLRLMILPELGGRIHVAVDKATGRDLFYRNNVIKPALVGLAGPWISGGVEFNWPQHHRPGTYLPTDCEIEEEADGSVTVWCSDHDPFARMKGMHGIRLRPDVAAIEARVRLFNRTPLTQTFLWWANVAVRVHDDYQSFFPTDVHHVADHARRAITSFPRADGRYYGVDYPARVTAEHPDADRIDWYRNIPVPTSYMCVATNDDFFGGYDHRAGLGFVHVADHRIAPGKKQWTWGNAPFGWAWDQNLTDEDGPYVELMAGVYTDNQPDFSYLEPGETKSFSQFWYPIHDIGPAHQANLDAAVRLDVMPDAAAARTRVTVGAAVTRSHSAVTVEVRDIESGAQLWAVTTDATPGRAVRGEFHLPGAVPPERLALRVSTAQGELITWTPRTASGPQLQPEAATELPEPAEIASADELYLAGVHLAQYRHATRSPEPYWEELLRRDELDSRANVALARRRIDAGLLADAEALLRRAIRRETRRNPNPASGEAHYLLGIVLSWTDRDDAAYDALAKSAWNAAWRAPAHLELARIDARAGRWAEALDHASLALRFEPDELQAVCLLAISARRLGRPEVARRALADARSRDPLHWWTRELLGEAPRTDAHTLQDLAAEYASLGLPEDALRMIDLALDAARTHPVIGAGNPVPMLHYWRAELLRQRGDGDAAADARASARAASSELAFARTLDDVRVLERVLEEDGADAAAHALLGHWLYAHRRYDDAIAHLTRSAEIDGSDPVVWRGLGLAAYNIGHDGDRAAELYRLARKAAPHDPKLLYEADQLDRRRGRAIAQRLRALEADVGIVLERDDLRIGYAELLALAGRPRDAIEVMASWRFQPWEGGEGESVRVWSLAHLLAADERPTDALELTTAAVETPQSLGEARHLLANYADVLLAHGDALAAAEREDDARAAWRAAADSAGDFTDMAAVPYSPMSFFSAVAATRLSDETAATALRNGLAEYVEELAQQTPSIDYFATSLPATLIFMDDLEARQSRLVRTLRAQLALLDRRLDTALELLARLQEEDPGDALVARLARVFAVAPNPVTPSTASI